MSIHSENKEMIVTKPKNEDEISTILSGKNKLILLGCSGDRDLCKLNGELQLQ